MAVVSAVKVASCLCADLAFGVFPDLQISTTLASLVCEVDGDSVFLRPIALERSKEVGVACVVTEVFLASRISVEEVGVGFVGTLKSDLQKRIEVFLVSKEEVGVTLSC